MRSFASALSLCLAILASGALLPATTGAGSTHTKLTDPVLQERFHDISQQLICQCGCNLVLDVCNHHNCGSATPMRARIDTELLAGRADEAIVAGFVNDMGLVVLAAPPASGFNLTAWLTPFVLLAVAAVVLTLLLRRWKSLAMEVPATAAPDGDGGSHSAQIEEELREL